jgi:CheY-like chemotaxis protein
MITLTLEKLLKLILGSSNAEAVVVGSGREALATIKNVHPDILISDLGMPEMDGYELLENVRVWIRSSDSCL